MLVRTAVTKRTVSSKKGLACWLIRSNAEPVLSLQEFVERELVLWRVDHGHVWSLAFVEPQVSAFDLSCFLVAEMIAVAV